MKKLACGHRALAGSCHLYFSFPGHQTDTLYSDYRKHVSRSSLIKIRGTAMLYIAHGGMVACKYMARLVLVSILPMPCIA